MAGPVGTLCMPVYTHALLLPFVLRKEPCMSRLTVAPSTQTLLRLVDGPAMLSKHVQIGKYIVDAVIIDAHPEVARWYGYNSPEEMQGRYLSQLHDPRCLAQV